VEKRMVCLGLPYCWSLRLFATSKTRGYKEHLRKPGRLLRVLRASCFS
jgi:hypothetical protein